MKRLPTGLVPIATRFGLRPSCLLLACLTMLAPAAFGQNAQTVSSPPTGAAAVDAAGDIDDYHQWKRALENDPTDPTTISAPPGYRVERLRIAAPGEGSWISIDFDPRGRLVIAKEDKGLLRLTFSGDGKEPHVESIDDTLLECRGLLHAYDALYVNANNSKALYRLRDTDGDDRFDEIKLLRRTEGGVGHGRNDLALGPDGMIYAMHGNNVKLPDDYKPAESPLRNWAEDQLTPCSWDQALFDSGVLAPAGYLARTDRDGKRWEVVAGGFRNPYGLDFNADGELFTYESDMEWDIGTPWYRPTRVLHLVSGGDYGYRQGTRMWPADAPDALPASFGIGKGSPTGVKFGERSRFPEKYRRALYIADWAYGRIFAIHLSPRGASYDCQAELFVKGRPLNVTDLDFGPDGAMYFVVGGRRTRSALYRVSYTGGETREESAESEASAAARSAEGAQSRALRRELAAFHGRQDPRAIDLCWPHLDSPEVWIRHAARVAIEAQPVETWSERALAETRPTAALTALIALARVGSPDIAARVFLRLGEFPLNRLDEDRQLLALRGYKLAIARLGRPEGEFAARIIERLDSAYPANSAAINLRLCELLVALDAADVVGKTMPLVLAAKTQEERLYYLFALRNVRRGWTLDHRRTYFEWLGQPVGFTGAQSIPIVLGNIQAEAKATLSESEQTQLADFFAALEKARQAEIAPAAIARPFVRDWKLDDFSDLLGQLDRGRNFDRGRALTAAATCLKCHRLADEGVAMGPDLAGAGNRFGRRDLLETILSPSKFVDEKYRHELIETAGGEVVVGRVMGGDDESLVVAVNPLDPAQVKRIAKQEIEFRTTSPLSPMPAGLLNTFNKDEVLDLLAYVIAGGDPEHRCFRP